MSDDGDDLDPRHIYVTQDGQFEYRRVLRDALVIRFHAPLDSMLRKLDEAYTTVAGRAVESALADHDVDPRGFSWGLGHPGEAIGIEHQHPLRPLLETIGWIGTPETLGDFRIDDPKALILLPRWVSIAEALEASDPPLCLMYDYYRGKRITRRGGEPIANDDGASHIETMRVDSADSPVDWNTESQPNIAPFLSIGWFEAVVAQLRARGELSPHLQALSDVEAARLMTRGRTESREPEGAPWVRLHDALAARDHIAVVDAMDAVRAEYSEHGARICLESATSFMMMALERADVTNL